MRELVEHILSVAFGVSPIYILLRKDKQQVIADYEKTRQRVKLCVIQSCTQCAAMKLESETAGYRQNGKVQRMVCSRLNDSPLETQGDAILRFENEAFGNSALQIKPHEQCPLKRSV